MYQKKTFDTTAENDASQKTILLVDDDDDEHEIFLSALKQADKSCTFLSADSCDEALKILKEVEPDYIFIDVNMPRTNGMICLEQIKKISNIAHVPVYMYSTGMNALDGKKAMQLGAVDYIIKPNSIPTLTGLLKKILV
ncbi:MAG: response regulator [Parafilimonas sp.]